MITGLLFAAALFVIALIVHWAMINDNVGDTGETKGIFAMREYKKARGETVDRKFRLPGG